jgi:E3 ubiquitin-protein ligase NEDD4
VSANFTRGFHDVVKMDYLNGASFSPEELQEVMGGSSFIDVDDWKNGTVYREQPKDGTTKKSDQSKADFFWKYINSLSEVKKRKVLEFVTASGPPAAGFKRLVGGKFVIVFGDGFDTSGMPWAQTCFNRLYLPSYKTSDELVFQFNRALEYASVGFGFD